ncbi:MAG: SGNH/GDSL hydrolase family protein [Candidatus Hydrogenedentes bacterium]|nr:SGNH/GDSL hydrolase family protein [Candidatus Hydrogenedentota bacterium]
MSTTPATELSRRDLIHRASALAGAAAVLGAATPGAHAATRKGTSLKQGDVILFQGDSITDAGRDKENKNPNSAAAFGDGYALMIASRLLGEHAPLQLKCYNRGISGHKVPDLDARWQADTLDLKPAVLSILIGVNDIWHKLNENYAGTVEDYEQGFTALLAKTRAALPEVLLVICDPFALRCGAVNDTWYPEFDERRAAARRVSDNAGAVWVPFQEVFDKAVKDGIEPAYWAADGVHPTMAGHALMADTWFEAVKLR